MAALKAIIIEDELLAQKRLKQLLIESTDLITIESTARDGEEGLELIKKHKPDVIFLDIQMPVMDGLEMLTHLEKQPFIIFTTAYDEYALRSFEENSIDYLLKPIKKERLQMAITKLHGITASSAKQSFNINQLQSLIHQMNQKVELKLIKVIKGDKIIFVKLDNIQHFMAEEKLTKIIERDGKYHFIIPSLKQLAIKLPGNFIQISRSCIINEEYLVEVRKGFNRKLVLEMVDGSKLTIGSSYLNALKARWSF